MGKAALGAACVSPRGSGRSAGVGWSSRFVVRVEVVLVGMGGEGVFSVPCGGVWRTALDVTGARAPSPAPPQEEPEVPFQFLGRAFMMPGGVVPAAGVGPSPSTG